MAFFMHKPNYLQDFYLHHKTTDLLYLIQKVIFSNHEERNNMSQSISF